jgi:alkyl sulfatase BDS1-like metallo-beta-lactamase superfamily hydrolase
VSGLATKETRTANNLTAERLSMQDSFDSKNATRGFIAAMPNGKAFNENGQVAVDATEYDFATGASPDMVNPSLWRHLQNCRHHGLFKVVDGMYQFRGYDGGVMTLNDKKIASRI